MGGLLRGSGKSLLYGNQNTSAAKRSAGVAPEVNLRGFHCTHVMKDASKGIHPGFEAQGRHHQKSKNRVSMPPQKD